MSCWTQPVAGVIARRAATKQSSASAAVHLDCFPRIKSGVAMTPVTGYAFSPISTGSTE